MSITVSWREHPCVDRSVRHLMSDFDTDLGIAKPLEFFNTECVKKFLRHT